MKKLFLLLFAFVLLASGNSYAAGIKFIENRTWKDVLAQAKRENKLIFLDAYASWCGPCKYLQSKVFTDSEVGNYYNKTFINVKMDMEEGEGIDLAKLFNVTSYPTLFFINGNGEIVHKYIGALESPDFIKLGKIAVNPLTQFYTVKGLARKGIMTPKDFHAWVHEAEKLEDEDCSEIVANYISKSNYSIMDKEMLMLIMDHGQLSGKAQMDILFRNRGEAASTLGLTLEDYNSRFLQKIIAFGNDRLKKDLITLAQFKTLIDAYYPEHSKLETKKAAIAYFKVNKENEKCLTNLKEIISDPNYKLDVTTMATMVLDYILVIAEEEKAGEFVKLVKNYKLSNSDINKVYYKDFAISLLYYSMDDIDNMSTYVKRLTDNEDTPESLIEFLLELLED